MAQYHGFIRLFIVSTRFYRLRASRARAHERRSTRIGACRLGRCPNVSTSASRLKTFAYVNVESAALYRDVMRTFMEAKERFSLHLRPHEVQAALSVSHRVIDDPPSIETALQQLCEWGNLERHPDTADVATVEEFYRPRFLYQLTPEGEAAEKAIAFYSDEILRSGELQTAALTDIVALLQELEGLGAETSPDEGRTHRTLSSLRSRFEELTSRAQAFIGSLQRSIDLHGAKVVEFLTYKETLINYLERFIGELRLATAEIATTLERIEAGGVERLLGMAAQRDLADAVAATDDDRTAAAARWRARWSGLRSWFIGRVDAPSQAEVLRSRARSAIPSLLSAIISINDRRVTRSDRVTDLRVLARWFAEADSDHDAHRLWRAAFALAPARHLRIDDATLDERESAPPVLPQTSWLDSPPLRIAPRLRRLGWHVHRGRPPNVIDRSSEKAMLRADAEAEAAQLATAQQRLATGGLTRLSELGVLNPVEFDVFLDLLGETLAMRVDRDDTVCTISSDGSLRITLRPTRDGSTAVIRSTIGRLSGPDHFITIEDVFAVPSPAVGDRTVGTLSSSYGREPVV